MARPGETANLLDIIAIAMKDKNRERIRARKNFG